jgi:hypothetical protein
MAISTLTKLPAIVAALTAALVAAAPAQAAYHWPLKPFNRRHPVRAYFGDPRIVGHEEARGTFHFGIDISAPNGTAVYATLDGVAGRNPLHPDVVVVSNDRGATHEYWHVIPAVRPGDRVVAFRTIVGHVEAPWGHVHFSEREGGVYVNPLRPGALEPYRDGTKPTIHCISLERNGRAVGDRVSGRIDIVAEAWDDTPLLVPAPWSDKPVSPALVEWRLAGNRELASSRWHVAADFRDTLPTVPFTSVYARWTRQNHPWGRGGRGRYRYELACGLDTRGLRNGTYHVVVLARDTAGNETQSSRTFTVANGV